MLWNAAYQDDLNKFAQQKQKKTFISHQVDNFDESDHEFGEDILNDSEEDDPSPYSVFQSSFNSAEPEKPTKLFISYQLWGDFPEATKQMIIDCNRKIKVPNPRPHFNGGNTKPKSTLGQSNPKPQQVHFPENDSPPENSSTETSPQTMVHECLSDGGMDLSAINNVMSAFKARLETHLKNHQEKSTPIKDMFLLELINLPTTWLIGEPVEEALLVLT